MQPYFLPYVGYFQLIAAVDKFVIYDNIQYTKKGWINRNRIMLNESPHLFSLPLRKDSVYLDINKRSLSKEFNRSKLLNKFQAAYHDAPYSKNIIKLLEEILLFDNENLFDFVHFSVNSICSYLDIKVPIIESSSIQIDHSLKCQEKVLSICQAMKAQVYINPIGGIHLYSKKMFENHGIELLFFKINSFEYPQFKGGEFVPHLSIIDLLMNCSLDETKQILYQKYNLL